MLGYFKYIDSRSLKGHQEARKPLTPARTLIPQENLQIRPQTYGIKPPRCEFLTEFEIVC